MKFLVLVVCSFAAALADVSLLTDRDGYTYSKPIPSVSLLVPEPVSPPTIAPTPGPVPAPASVEISHGPVEQSVGQSVVSLGHSFGNTGLVGSLPTQSYIPPVVPSPKYFGVATAAVSVPALGSMDFSAYLPPQPKYQAPAPFKSYSAPAIVSGYNAGIYNGEGSLVSLGHVSPAPLPGYQALGPQVEAHSVGALGYFGSASLSGYHAQNLANIAEYQNQVSQTQAQALMYSAPTVAHQQQDAPTSGSVTPSNEYLPAESGQLDVRSLGGSQDLISAPVTAPLTQYAISRGPHSTSPSSAGDANLSSGPLAAPQLAAPQLTAPQLAAPAAADQKEYSAPASKTGGYHYNVPV